jgi:hypothetical protein
MEPKDIPIQLPALWPIISTKGVTKVMKLVIGFLRQHGIRLIIYLDDMLIFCRHQKQLEDSMQLVINLFQSLGLLINFKKSMVKPVQQIEFLGFTICSRTMQIYLPQEKVRKIRQDARGLLAQPIVNVRELARFLGKTSAAARVAPLHYRALQAMVNSAIPMDYSREEIATKYNTELSLTPKARVDLSWWSPRPHMPTEPL